MSHYRNGRAFEHRVKQALEQDGYWVLLAPGSKGAADMIAAKAGQWLVIQVKRRHPYLLPAERGELLYIAQLVGAIPVVAYQPVPRKPIEYRELTGHQSKDWASWAPDEAVTG